MDLRTDAFGVLYPFQAVTRAAVEGIRVRIYRGGGNTRGVLHDGNADIVGGDSSEHSFYDDSDINSDINAVPARVTVSIPSPSRGSPASASP